MKGNQRNIYSEETYRKRLTVTRDESGVIDGRVNNREIKDNVKSGEKLTLEGLDAKLTVERSKEKNNSGATLKTCKANSGEKVRKQS